MLGPTIYIYSKFILNITEIAQYFNNNQNYTLNLKIIKIVTYFTIKLRSFFLFQT